LKSILSSSWASHAVARANLAKAKVVTRTGNSSGGCAPGAFPGEAFDRHVERKHLSFPFGKECIMPVGFPSIRVDRANPLHHLWCNNGTWWVHYTIHFDHRKRRIRRSLETRSLTEAILRRDSLLLQITSDGETVPERKRDGGAAAFDHRTVA
jgi:hypothetical protein